jgi:hemerythrin-like domain-containing protein
MPTTKTARRPAATKTASARQPDAIALLKEDHAKVNALFEQYEKSRSATKKQSIVATICRELTIHAMVEEEIFYPAVKAALKDKELVPEAIVEHATLKEFIAKLDGRLPEGEMFDAQVKVLGEYVKHHVKEEQNEMFPKARKTRLDLAALGEQILDRKQALMADPDGLPKAPEAVAELADEEAA